MTTMATTEMTTAKPPIVPSVPPAPKTPAPPTVPPLPPMPTALPVPGTTTPADETTAAPKKSKKEIAASAAGKAAVKKQGQCATTSQDCRKSGCCADSSLTCYRKDAYWGACMTSCNPDQYLSDGTQWNCEVITEPTNKITDSASMDFSHCSAKSENCQTTRCCRDPTMTCFEKNDNWASCQLECKQGEHRGDPTQFLTPWTCNILEQDGNEETFDEAQEDSSVEGNAEDVVSEAEEEASEDEAKGLDSPKALGAVKNENSDSAKVVAGGVKHTSASAVAATTASGVSVVAGAVKQTSEMAATSSGGAVVAGAVEQTSGVKVTTASGQSATVEQSSTNAAAAGVATTG